ncbi:MAG: HEAT repeat domain-containing protein [Proteobacteria bacterium]|nr:HEAT repeat domain-containing protein [Pseudomonadota bacterium]
MRHAFALAAVALLLSSPPAVAQEGPPLPLAGVPVDFQCLATVAGGHPLLDRHTGQDLHDLAREGEEDPEDLVAWLDEYLCDLIWSELESAGAHASPTDVRLPARAVLNVELVSAHLEGTRMVEQRIGASVMPVNVPHWQLAMRWRVSFDIEYSQTEDAVVVRTGSLELNPAAGAEQDDYSPLRLGALLRASTRGAFSELPRILADEGRLGDLLFAVVERPPGAPADLAVSGALSDGFWNLLAPRADHRHDSLAFYLASDRVPLEGRVALARWFLLNDSDLGLRRDALAWLMAQEGPADAERPLSEPQLQLLHWVLARDKSPRMRAEVTSALVGRVTPEIRDLLLVASVDPDRRVSDVATGALRKFAPPTAAELQAADLGPTPPQLVPWTAALDGRLALPPGNPDRFLLVLASAAGGSAADTWTARWLDYGAITADDDGWALQAWEALAAHPSRWIRERTLSRLSQEVGMVEVEQILLGRIEAEEDPELRVAAIEALDRGTAPGTVGVLLEAAQADDATVRSAAAVALGQVPGKEARGRLELMMRNDPDGRVRRKAKKALRAHDRLGG